MDESQATEKKIKTACMDEKAYRAFCQLLGKERIPQRVVDEWAQFKVYADRLGVGTMPMPSYVMMLIAQRAGACPHIPVSVDVNGDVEPEPVATERTAPYGPLPITTTVPPDPIKKPYTGKKRGRKPGSGKKPGRPAKVNEPELVTADG